MWRLPILFAAMVSMVMARNYLWENYKEKYDLSFEDHEETDKLTAFEANLKFINEHNFDADLGKHTYWLGVNQFTHMTNEEYIAKVIGNCLLDRNTTQWAAEYVHEYDPTHTSAAGRVDWREKGAVTPVKNQTGALEGQHFRQTGRLISLSEQNLVDCSLKYGNLGCNGGLMDNAFTYIKANGGVDSAAKYPYIAEFELCHFKKSDVGATDTGFVDIMSGDELALRSAVATVGPVSVAIDASKRSFQLYKRGVYYDPQCSSTTPTHAVLAVGYGTDNTSGDYWIIKNSWSTYWGNDGYILMARNMKNHCGVATQASFPLV